MTMNNLTQEIIIGDDYGRLSIIKIFNKSQFQTKVTSNKILQVFNLEIFNEAEHILLLTEESIEIFKLKRESKTNNILLHDKEIVKLFYVPPLKYKEEVVDDAK